LPPPTKKGLEHPTALKPSLAGKGWAGRVSIKFLFLLPQQAIADCIQFGF